MSESVGTIAAIHRFPVKSMMGETLERAAVAPSGLAGDRAYALVDPATDRIGTAKIPRKWGTLFQSSARYLTEPAAGAVPPAQITFPDGSLAATDDPDIDKRFSELVGFAVKLMSPVKPISEKPARLLLESPPLGTVPESDDAPTVDFPVINGFFDLGAVHLLTTATMDRLREAYPGGRFEVRRFRPNFVIATPPGEQGFAEEAWIGKTLAIGDEVRLKLLSPTLRCVVTTLAQGDLPNDPGILKTAAQQNKANVGVYALVEQPGTVRVGDALRVDG